jgi:K+-transporting ATPase ATPase B chain
MTLEALLESFKKLDSRLLAGNPVMFVVEIGFFFTLVEAVYDWLTGESVAKFETYIAILLLFTVLFSTFAEAIAEGWGKAQAESLRRAKKGACQKDNRQRDN